MVKPYLYRNYGPIISVQGMLFSALSFGGFKKKIQPHEIELLLVVIILSVVFSSANLVHLGWVFPVENEYGSWPTCDHEYMAELASILR